MLVNPYEDKICELEDRIMQLTLTPVVTKPNVNLVGLHHRLLSFAAHVAKYETQITSGDDGKHTKNSKHYHGEALDYRFRTWTGEGIELARYLNSSAGQEYLRKNNLRAVLEIKSKRTYNRLKEEYSNIIKYKPNINASHLHIELINV